MTNRLSISCMLTMATILISLGSRAHLPENDLRKGKYIESYCKLIKTTDASLNGKMRVYGTIVLPYNQKLISDPIIVSVNDRDIDTVKQGRFELQFSEGDIIKYISFRSPYYQYEIVASEAILFQANKSLKYEVGLNERIIEEAEKPVIYLYAEKDQEVDINLNINGQLKFSYPEYKDGWTCTATSDGTIEMNGQSYDYLFYDAAISREAYKPHEGFVVAGRDVVGFLERNLTKIGLNASERNDFITYWAPRMVKNEFNHVQFLINEDYDAISTIDVSPKPETSIRLYMFFQGVDASHSVTHMELPSYKRNGFTLIEWGGTEVQKLDKTP